MPKYFDFKPFCGMVSTKDFPIDQGTGRVDARKLSIDDVIQFVEWNGDVPLTAILGLGKDSSISDPEFHWFEEMPFVLGGNVTSCNTSSLLTVDNTNFTTNPIAYIRTTEEVARHFNQGSNAWLRGVHPTSGVNISYFGEVVGVNYVDTSSYVAIRILNGDFSLGMVVPSSTSIKYIQRAGSAFPEGSGMPESKVYNPIKRSNFSQIFLNTLEMTRTATQTDLRYGNNGNYADEKRKTLRLHAIDREYAFLYNPIKSEAIGLNGKVKRLSMGLMGAIMDAYLNDPNPFKPVIADFRTDPDVPAGSTWEGFGREWINIKMEKIFRLGGTERMGFCDGYAKLAVQNLIEGMPSSSFAFKPDTIAYGININRWEILGYSLLLKTHPLMSIDSYSKGTVIIFDPKDIGRRTLQKTIYIDGDGKSNIGNAWFDGKKECFLTEEGLKYRHPCKMAILSGFGSDKS